MEYYSRKLKAPFQEVLEKMIQNLNKEGFGIIATIDLQEAFLNTLNVCFRNYKILVACNPHFAYRAVSMESHLGIMLPCNVVIQEHENSEVEVSAVSPFLNIDQSFNTLSLKDLGHETGIRLRGAIDSIEDDHIPGRSEALPEETIHSNPYILG